MSKEETAWGHEAPNEPEGDLLSRTEISAEIDALSLADQRKLRKAARFISKINGLDDDQALLQEAMVRAFEGRRRCPRALPVVAFLFGAMRSIASSAAKSARRSPVDRFAAVRDEAEDAPRRSGTEQADACTPERETFARDMLKKIDELFKDDADAQMVLYAMAEGLQGQELRKELGLTETEHNTIRKRILRQSESLAVAWRAG
jgi:DNA-directed RNA polymerase specialized sigma24 family protein